MSKQHTPEPFGYFKVEPFGWIDCAETDEGAHPLYDEQTVDLLVKQRDELLAALESQQLETSCECKNCMRATAAISSVKDHFPDAGKMMGGAA